MTNVASTATVVAHDRIQLYIPYGNACDQFYGREHAFKESNHMSVLYDVDSTIDKIYVLSITVRIPLLNPNEFIANTEIVSLNQHIYTSDTTPLAVQTCFEDRE